MGWECPAPRRPAAAMPRLRLNEPGHLQDAKEKFLSLERERLEEQERVMQLNLEKRRANQQQPQHRPQSPPSPHSPQVRSISLGTC